MNKQLKKSADKRIAGVCGGVANYLDVDPTVIRIVWLCAIIFGGAGVLAYLICWLLMPEA
ncbi:MAG: PspC domain-containing protein [Bacteroidales bacterium]|nr:PspC domain-containing protein [Bacteroidales bacterium]